MFSTTAGKPNVAASWRPRSSEASEESRSGMNSPCTRSGPSARAHSSVTAALCARALGPERVQGLFMPERDSSDASLDLGRQLAATFGFPAVVENIGPIVAAAGCYERQ